MKLSKKTDNAIMVLLYLRNNQLIDPNYISALQISADLNISYNNIRKLFGTLNELGFTGSKLGQNGGVALLENYNQLSIKQLLITFEEVDNADLKIDCAKCNITSSCSFEHITRQALANFYSTYNNVYLDDL